MNPLLETKHETYGALGIAGLLAGMLNAQMEPWRFFGLLTAVAVLVIFAGIQRLMIKRWKIQYGATNEIPDETSGPTAASAQDIPFIPSSN